MHRREETQKWTTLPHRCISSTAEGAHMCEPTTTWGLCHLGAPRHAIIARPRCVKPPPPWFSEPLAWSSASRHHRPPALRQATAAVVRRAARPRRIKLPSRSSALLVSVVSRYAALRSLLRCVLLCTRRVEVTHSPCPPRPRLRQALPLSSPPPVT
jgi:hypothetical protein